MKRNHKQMWRTVIALVLTFTLVFGSMSTAFATSGGNDATTGETVKYVSLGDSMTNGYGLDGYEPNGKNYYGFNVAAPQAYPALVAEKLGADLTQLATSGLRAEDLCYLLNYENENGVKLELDEYGRYYVDSKFEDYVREFIGSKDYDYTRKPGGYLPNDEAHEYIIGEAAKIFQQSIKDADVISIGIGSNNFATLLDMRVMYWMGLILGSESMFADSGYPGEFNFDELMGDLTSEEKAQIGEIYASVEEIIKDAARENGISLETELAKDLTLGDFALDIANAVAYTSAGFAVGYKGTIDAIIRDNSDAEIIIVGLTNWFSGMNFGLPVEDEMLVLPMGDIMEVVCEFAGVYMAGLPAAYEAEAKLNGTEMQPIYFADTNDESVGDVELLVEQIIKNSPSVDFTELNALEGEEKFAKALEMAQGIDISEAIPEGTTGPRLEETLAATTPSDPPFILEGVKKSMIASLHADVVNVEHFKVLSSMDVLGEKVMGVIYSVMFEGGEPNEYWSNIIQENCTADHIAAAFMCTPELVTISNLLFNFVVGSGVILHPSIDGHETIADVIVDAYDKKWTATDETIENIIYYVSEYYDDAYKYAYQYAKDAGYIDEAIKGIDTAIDAMEELKTILEDNEPWDFGMTDELYDEVVAQVKEIIETLETAKALIVEADVLDQASLDALLALLHEAGQDMNQLGKTLAQAGVDTYNLVIIPALEEAYDILMNEVLPQIQKQLQIAIEKGTEWLINKLEEVYAEFVEWLINEALPGADNAMYDWLYNNPETVINFFIEYGDDMAPYIEEYGDEVVAVLMYALYTYGPDAVEWAIENPEEAIATWVKWYNKHGHKVWPMIDKYLKTMDEMGMFDDVKAAMKEAAEQLEAYVIAYAEKVVAELQAIYDELNEAAQAALAELKAAIEEADVDAILAALEELYDAGVAIWDGATSGYYAATEDSYYVALGDTNVEYAEIVAEELDLEKDQFVNYGIEDMTAAELKAYLNAGDEDLIAEIEKADLITLGFSNNTITKAAADALAAVMAGEEVDFDWTPYVGKEGAEAMDVAIEAIEAALVAEGADAATIDMVATVVEAYAFACTEFACNYPEAINAIKAINPEAQVVVVGMYNPFENAVLSVEGVEVPVGDFVGMLVDLANVHYTSYALLTGNAIYVHAPAVETKAPFEEAMDIAGFASVLTDLDSLEPSAAGHEYIAEQILDAMNVVSKAVYDAQKLIDEIKAFGEVTRDNLADAKALAEAARAAWDKLTDEEKALIGLDNYKVLVDFELAVAKVELGVAEDIAAAEKALAEAQAKAAEIERALKITESTVANLKAKVVNKSQIKVTWEAAEVTPDQYRVTLMKAGKKAGTYWVAGDKETVTLKNVLRGANFTVRVTPVAKVDGKKYFSIYKTSNKVKTQLQKANLTVKKAGLKKQIISKDQNSTGFQIYISKDKKFKKNVKKLVYKTNKKGLNVKVKAKNFKKGTNYVKVRAYTKVNGKTVYGAWSGTVKVVK